MSIELHGRERQIEFGRSIAQRRKIYLDTRFWIILRDVALGICAEPAALRLLHYLRLGVANGRLICPINASTFLELMKQAYSPARRIGTAEIADELSLGASIVPLRIVMGTEIYSFLLRAPEGADLHPMQELIWTKATYVLGNMYPSLPKLTPAEELLVQKSLFDHLWSYSLTDMVKAIGDAFIPRDSFAELSRETNENNAERKRELRSFAQTYDIEIRGIIELAGEIAADVIYEIAEKETGIKYSSTSPEHASVVNMCRNLLYGSFRKQDTKHILRSLHIGASIHAAMRWDKERKFKPNDYYDFEHATAALGYFDAFLTEAPLHHLVTRPHLGLEALNGCQIFWEVEKAADYIGQLVEII